MTNDARGRFRVRAPMDSLIRFVRTRMVLIVSAAAALITMVFVPFDEAYLATSTSKRLRVCLASWLWWVRCAASGSSSMPRASWWRVSRRAARR
ncbi:hypothetical protein [Enteroscipio rubneri]|uniref:hypothetical protein n=1 Tax=Enteroscipio rubneri TaxID=2070686 RepID=UPI0032085DAD